ncbi:hypothetical protein EVAR_69363_1 [Eumeta japonica]|uniref:Uncharacterized protein n=1 Tax=Eumeta variegata TaxID=151549 RepID=A0A4C1SDN5_EUMVA|nr:hypothetical protein EVAR_69363_1 [Eumeta japonica]
MIKNGNTYGNIIRIGIEAGREGKLELVLRLRLGVTLKSVTLGNVTMSHRTREEPPNALSLSHSTMIGLRAQH